MDPAKVVTMTRGLMTETLSVERALGVWLMTMVTRAELACRASRIMVLSRVTLLTFAMISVCSVVCEFPSFPLLMSRKSDMAATL